MASLLKMLQPGTTCSDLLSCLFELNQPEANLYLALVREGPLKLDRLAELAGRERSTVYRCLAKLVSLGLVNKDSRTLPGGGYFHLYSALEPTHLKAVVEARLAEFNHRMTELLEEFEAHVATAALTAAPGC